VASTDGGAVSKDLAPGLVEFLHLDGDSLYFIQNTYDADDDCAQSTIGKISAELTGDPVMLDVSRLCARAGAVTADDNALYWASDSRLYKIAK
jgi:hypothetical protein